MERLTMCCGAVALAATLSPAQSLFDTQERTALVADVDGKTREFRNPEFPGMCSDFGLEWGSCLVVRAEPFRIAIPSSAMSSIHCPGTVRTTRLGSSFKACEIGYSFAGVEQTLVGAMDNGIKGTTPEGSEFVELDRLKAVTFRGPAAAVSGERPPEDATLVLRDGREIRVAGLQAEYGDFVRATYPVVAGGSTRRRPEGVVNLTKAGKQFTLRFSELRSIEFLPGSQVSVTAANGDRALADLDHTNRRELRNLSGVSKDGMFQVFVGDLKAIRFDPAPPQ